MVKELSVSPMIHIPFANGILDEKTVKIGFGLSVAITVMMVINIISYYKKNFGKKENLVGEREI